MNMRLRIVMKKCRYDDDVMMNMGILRVKIRYPTPFAWDKGEDVK